MGSFGIITTDTAEYTYLQGTIAAAAATINLGQSARDGSAGIMLDDTNFANNSVILASAFYFV